MPLEPKLVPPAESRIVGQQENGDPIYERDLQVVVGREPVVVNGVEQWRKHPTTGEPITPVMRVKTETITQRFTLVPMGNGTVQINPHFEPDPAEKARQDRQEKVKSFMERFAETAVDQGLDDPEAAIAAILSGGEEEDAPKPRRKRAKAEAA